MKSEMFWQLFLKTGSPEAYLMYHDAKRMEQTHVLENEWSCGSGHTLQ